MVSETLSAKEISFITCTHHDVRVLMLDVAIRFSLHILLFRKENLLEILPSVLRRCWLGGRKGILPVKTEW